MDTSSNDTGVTRRTMLAATGAAIVGSRLGLAAQPGSASQAAPVVATKAGRIQGEHLDGVNRFLGIHYAQSIAGGNRFAPPKPVEPWTGVLPCTAIASTGRRRS